MKNLTLKSKLIILFIDYIIIIIIISFLEKASITGLEQHYPWFFRLFIYILYYVIPEFFFKKTLGMRILKVKITDNNENKDFVTRFLIYTFLIFLDRFFFLIFYLFSAMMMFNNKLLLSEKLTNLRWEKITPTDSGSIPDMLMEK